MFDERFRSELQRLLAWRRDVRRFRGEPLPPDTIERLIEIACSSPSVGLSQPWRFVLVDDQQRRQRVIEEFCRCNQAALNTYAGDEAAAYGRLKLAGLQEAPCHLAVFTDRDTSQGRGLGRLTMPETAEYSAVAAIMTLWLAARADGIGLGWVSIIDPERITAILSVPEDWRFVAYLCLGYPETACEIPELEQQRWEGRRPAREFITRR